MHIPYAWRLAVRQFPLIVVTTLLGLAAAYGFTSLTQTWSSTAYLTVQPTKEQAGVRAVDPLRFFQTQTQQVRGDALLRAATTAVADKISVEQLRDAVELSDGASADVLGVTVSGRSAEIARDRQQAVQEAISTHSFGDITMTPLYTTPMVGPSRDKALATGAAAGFAAGVLLVLLWGAARRPVYGPRYLQVEGDVRTYPVPVDVDDADEVKRFASWLDQPASQLLPVGRSGDQASRLADRIAVDRGAGGPKVLVVASGGATEGAVEEQISLASQQGPPVLVVASSRRRAGARR